MKRKEPEMLKDESWGVHIPREFADVFGDNWGVSPHDKRTLLAGPDHGNYWDTWETVLYYAHHIDKDGCRWCLYQDGGLWAVPHGMEWSDEADWFVWPTEDS